MLVYTDIDTQTRGDMYKHERVGRETNQRKHGVLLGSMGLTLICFLPQTHAGSRKVPGGPTLPVRDVDALLLRSGARSQPPRRRLSGSIHYRNLCYRKGQSCDGG